MARLKALPWHDAARAAIGQLLARQVHAVLLHGAAGTGKLDLALDTAEALLCERRVQDGSPCGRCPGCTLVAAGNHPDLRIVRPEALAEADSRIVQAPGEEPAEGASAGAPAEARGHASRGIRIEQIRDLSEWITLSTHRGGARVIVIEPAESMNTPASNALLKVLEERRNAADAALTLRSASGAPAGAGHRAWLAPAARRRTAAAAADRGRRCPARGGAGRAQRTRPRVARSAARLAAQGRPAGGGGSGRHGAARRSGCRFGRFVSTLGMGLFSV